MKVFVLTIWLACGGAALAVEPSPRSWDIAASPVMRPAGGVFTNAVSVTLTAAPAAVVRYTLDGRVPTTNSPAATAAVVVAESQRLRARAFQPGYEPSDIVGAPFTILSGEVREFSSNLPLLVLNTYGRSLQKAVGKDARTAAYLTIIGTNAGRARLLEPAQFQGRVNVKYHGSSSMKFPKKPLRLEFDDETHGLDRKVPLLDLPEDSDWVLYPPYSDKTFMRNVLAFDLWEDMGHYSVRRRFVELFWNQHGGLLRSDDYQGVYVLLEKIKHGKSRVDIAALHPGETNEPAISGGYILKKDRLDANDNPFTTSLGHPLGIEYPKATHLAPAQRQWIQRWFNEFESVLMSTNYTNPTNGYAKYLDVRSCIDHFWIVEMPKTIDGYALSMFMHKDRNGKLVLSPIWDRDLSFGNVNYLTGEEPTGWFWAQIGDDLWFRRLFTDAEFKQQHIDRWGELRAGLFATSNLFARIDAYAALLDEAQRRDFARWPRLGEYVWPNGPEDVPNKTYADTVNYMKKFITARMAWLEAQFVPRPMLGTNSGAVPRGFTLALRGGTNAIYFTLDGSDPRLPGGQISPTAKQYGGPFPLMNPARVFARCRRDAAWSPPTRATFTISQR